jgi:endogenous inhibitor of DNA gyrase (YacG/DUF329 family)
MTESRHTPPAFEARTVRCPACGGPSQYAADNPHRPFCGQRCKSIDFSAWASEQFAVPETLSNQDPNFERS